MDLFVEFLYYYYYYLHFYFDLFCFYLTKNKDNKKRFFQVQNYNCVGSFKLDLIIAS